ncbi:MAG TPA: methyltransferase domain-containing protein [Actinomycetes bacterium]|nr:methyltransferase domain-containing protein [Actinomycetes bacterium]
MVATVSWDPSQYLKYADERGRPFVELVERIGAIDPHDVVDLGCGPGNLTELLVAKWPGAGIRGVDSSAEMIERAQPLAVPGRLEFEIGDIQTWAPDRPVDVLISNAALHWVADHPALIPRLASQVAPGGWLAFQVPGNHDEPAHRLLRELAGQPRWQAALAGAGFEPGRLRRLPMPARDYLELLGGRGWWVDAWETTYLHVLLGPDPVYEWISGTGARPVLAALGGSDRDEFVAEYKRLLREAYPARPYGTVLPFRRIFVVARRPA